MCIITAYSSTPSKPDGMLESTYQAGLKTIETIDDYNDNKFTGDEAYLIMDDQKHRFKRTAKDSDEGYEVQDAVETLQKIFEHNGRSMEEIDAAYDNIKNAFSM